MYSVVYSPSLGPLRMSPNIPLTTIGISFSPGLFGISYPLLKLKSKYQAEQQVAKRL